MLPANLEKELLVPMPDWTMDDNHYTGRLARLMKPGKSTKEALDVVLC